VIRASSDPSTQAAGGRHLVDPPLPVLGLAALGVAAGHLLTYLVIVPNADARAALLARTGHGYFSLFAQLALVLGAIGAASSVLGALGRPPSRPDATFRRLAALQVVAFVWMEFVERVVSHAGFGDLFRTDVVLGALVQVAVAALLAWVVSLLRRAVREAALAVRARPPRPVAALALALVGRPAGGGLALVPPSRAPPRTSPLAA
jgi:hypothetical protein